MTLNDAFHAAFAVVSDRINDLQYWLEFDPYGSTASGYIKDCVRKELNLLCDVRTILNEQQEKP